MSANVQYIQYSDSGDRSWRLCKPIMTLATLSGLEFEMRIVDSTKTLVCPCQFPSLLCGNAKQAHDGQIQFTLSRLFLFHPCE